MGHALDPQAGQPGLAQVFEHAIRHRSHMAVGPRGGHDHVVGDGGIIAQVDGGGVLGLHVVEAREDDAERLVGVRSRLGDDVGAVGAGPQDCNCGQRFLPFPFHCAGHPARGHACKISATR